jgi:tetratricopeptide (TPR) repeat protein
MLAEMEKDLERAVQLDPNFADAYGWLALSLTWEGKRDEAVAPAEKAVKLSPRNQQWAMNLASFYANAKRYDDSLQLLQRLTHSDEPTIAQQATSMYESLSRFKAQTAEYEALQKKREQEESAMAAHTASEENDAPSSATPVLRHREGGQSEVSNDAVLSYFAGTLLRVSCSGKQSKFEIASPGEPLMLVAPDVYQVSFSGSQTFSCGLHGIKVKGFYSKKSNGNELVALEFEDNRAGR